MLDGFFSDNVTRNITGSAGITYAFAHGKASFDSVEGNIRGETLGADTLTISYLGQSATVYISITDSSNWVAIPLDTGSTALASGLGSLHGNMADTATRLS